MGEEAEKAHYESLRKEAERNAGRVSQRKKFERKIDHEKQAKAFLASGDPERTGIDPSKPARVAHDGRAKDLYEKKGYYYHKAEYYNAFSRRKHDFLGIFDAVVFKESKGIIGVQITTTENVAARRKKILKSPAFAAWKAAGGKAHLLSFKKENGRWQPVLEVL